MGQFNDALQEHMLKMDKRHRMAWHGIWILAKKNPIKPRNECWQTNDCCIKTRTSLTVDQIRAEYPTKTTLTWLNYEHGRTLNVRIRQKKIDFPPETFWNKRNEQKRAFSLAFLLWHKSNTYLFTACSRTLSDIVCILQLNKSKHSESKNKKRKKQTNDVPYKLQPAHYQSFVFALNSLCALFLLVYSSLEDNRLGACIFGFCPCDSHMCQMFGCYGPNILQICSFTLMHCYDMQWEAVRKKAKW